MIILLWILKGLYNQLKNLMSLFGNQNFMIQIAKEIGCPHLSEDTAAMMQLLVEI